MGADKNILCIEPKNAELDEVESVFNDGEIFDGYIEKYNDTIFLTGYGSKAENAKEFLKENQEVVDRAFLMHIFDTVGTAEGWVYMRKEDELVKIDEVSGGWRYGIDVVDYVKRGYDIDGPR